MSVPLPANEVERVEALRRLRLLDTGSDPRFDRITALAARLFHTPIAIVSLVDSDRVWIKSCFGQSVREKPREPYDVVLMDMQMPELDGLDATREIRSATGSAVVPWIIAMTANASSSDREACLASGMNDFLAKPVRPHELKDALRRVNKASIQATQSSTCVQPDTDIAGTPPEQHRTKLRSLHIAYMEDARTTIADLDSLARGNDFHNLQRKAHYLKGSSLLVGAVEIAKLCKTIEEYATAQKPVLSIVEELHRCFAVTSINFELVLKAGE